MAQVFTHLSQWGVLKKRSPITAIYFILISRKKSTHSHTCRHPLLPPADSYCAAMPLACLWFGSRLRVPWRGKLVPPHRLPSRLGCLTIISPTPLTYANLTLLLGAQKKMAGLAAAWKIRKTIHKHPYRTTNADFRAHLTLRTLLPCKYMNRKQHANGPILQAHCYNMNRNVYRTYTNDNTTIQFLDLATTETSRSPTYREKVKILIEYQ